MRTKKYSSPRTEELEDCSIKFGGKGLYAIINMIELTEEQYNKLTK